jgi:purine-nucleoside phosphorylase
MNRALDARTAAKFAAIAMAKRLDIPEKSPPNIALILGTGWGDALPWDRPPAAMPFKDIDSFKDLDQLEGHARQALYGTVADTPILALSGRIHLNEASDDPYVPRMVRLHAQMLLELGIRTLVATAAVGGLVPAAATGNVVVIDGLVTVFAPDLPLFVGEFCSPEDILDEGLQQIALGALEESGFDAVSGGHVMVRGPFFEGRKYDKPFLRASFEDRMPSPQTEGKPPRKTGASVVGMSILPELAIASLYRHPGKIDPNRTDKAWLVPARALALGFVTNNDTEVHEHETNQKRVKAKSEALGKFLKILIPRLAAS